MPAMLPALRPLRGVEVCAEGGAGEEEMVRDIEKDKGVVEIVGCQVEVALLVVGLDDDICLRAVVAG